MPNAWLLPPILQRSLPGVWLLPVWWRGVVDLADRRRHTLELTVEAEHILERLSPVHLAEIRELAPKFIDVLIKLNKMANEPE